MAIAYKLSGRLKQALAKVAALPHEEQDEVAAMIMARLSGDEWAAPQARPHVSAAGDFLDTVLPKHPVARTLSLTMGAFILCVQAPAALLFGVLMIVQAATAEPSGATRVSQLSVGGENYSVVRVTAPNRETKPVAPDDSRAETR